MLKNFIIAGVLLASSSVMAAGVEEICNLQADTDSRVHALIQKDPSKKDYLLDSVTKNDKLSKEGKERIRERIFYSLNRLDMSKEDVRKLSFLKCYSEFNN